MTLSHVDMMDRSRALSDLSVVPSDSGALLLFLSCPEDVLDWLWLALDVDRSDLVEGSVSWRVVTMSFKRSLNSITEVSLLPRLVSWLPSLLAGVPTHLQGDLLAAASGQTDEQMTIFLGDEGQRRPLLSLFLLSLQKEFCAHLANMLPPSASEQCSPLVLQNMVLGLRNLISAPVVGLVTGQPFGCSQWATKLDRTKRAPVASRGNEKGIIDKSFLVNYRKMIVLWLQFEALREADEASVAQQRIDSPREWSERIFSARDSHLSAPFTGAVFSPREMEGQEVEEMSSVLLDFRFSVSFLSMFLGALASEEVRPLLEKIQAVAGCIVAYSAGLTASFAQSLRRLSVLLPRDETALDDFSSCFLEVLDLFQTAAVLCLQRNLSCNHIKVGRSGSNWKYFVLDNLLEAIVEVLNRVDGREDQGILEVVDNALLAVFSSCGAVLSHEVSRWRGAAASPQMRPLLRDLMLRHGGLVHRKTQQLPDLLEGTWQIVDSAWREFGDGRDLRTVLGSNEGQSVPPTQGQTESAAAVAAGKVSGVPSSSSSASVKRSFLQTTAANRPTENKPSKIARIAIASPKLLSPSDSPHERDMVRVHLSDGQMDALQRQGGRQSRQGIVPATYSSADRVRLDAQSQLLGSQEELALSEQSVGLLASQHLRAVADELNKEAGPTDMTSDYGSAEEDMGKMDVSKGASPSGCRNEAVGKGSGPLSPENRPDSATASADDSHSDIHASGAMDTAADLSAARESINNVTESVVENAERDAIPLSAVGGVALAGSESGDAEAASQRENDLTAQQTCLNIAGEDPSVQSQIEEEKENDNEDEHDYENGNEIVDDEICGTLIDDFYFVEEQPNLATIDSQRREQLLAEFDDHLESARRSFEQYQQNLGQSLGQGLEAGEREEVREQILAMWFQSSKLAHDAYELIQRLKH